MDNNLGYWDSKVPPRFALNPYWTNSMADVLCKGKNEEQQVYCTSRRSRCLPELRCKINKMLCKKKIKSHFDPHNLPTPVKALDDVEAT